jgi:hypothetical protein
LVLSPTPRSDTLSSTQSSYYVSSQSLSKAEISDIYLSAEECVALYLDNCKKYGVPPDPGVIVSLQTR